MINSDGEDIRKYLVLIIAEKSHTVSLKNKVSIKSMIEALQI